MKLDYGIALYAAAFILLGDAIAGWISEILKRRYPNGINWLFKTRPEYYKPNLRFIVAVIGLCIAAWLISTNS